MFYGREGESGFVDGWVSGGEVRKASGSELYVVSFSHGTYLKSWGNKLPLIQARMGSLGVMAGPMQYYKIHTLYNYIYNVFKVLNLVSRKVL